MKKKTASTLSLPNEQDASDALSRVGQGEDGGELKDLPNKLVLKGLLNHKDKVRLVETKECPPPPAPLSPPEDEENGKKELT